MSEPCIPPFSKTADVLNIAALQSPTYTMGPGKRAALWVQGCSMACPGCLAPEWQDQKSAQKFSPQVLADILAGSQQLDGLTLSGGEPVLQGRSLPAFIRSARKYQPHLNVICFTGYIYEFLIGGTMDAVMGDLLQEVDLLIDGPFIQSLNDGLAFRGSTNQRFFHLSTRLQNFSPETWVRKVELHIQNGEILLSGIPTRSVLDAFDNAAISISRQEGMVYERS